MAILSVSTDIDSPIEEVFDYAADQRTYTDWCPGVAMCEMTSAGEVGVGATRNMKMSSTGFSFDWDWVCDEYDRPQRIVWSSDNDPRTKMVDVITFDEVDGRTRVTHDLDYELGGLLKWLRLVWRVKGKRRMAHDLSNLKRIIEEMQQLPAQGAGQ